MLKIGPLESKQFIEAVANRRISAAPLTVPHFLQLFHDGEA
jgi:hypothetical protein